MANSELRRELSLELFLVVGGKHYLGTASGGSFLFALNAWRKFFLCLLQRIVLCVSYLSAYKQKTHCTHTRIIGTAITDSYDLHAPNFTTGTIRHCKFRPIHLKLYSVMKLSCT